MTSMICTLARSLKTMPLAVLLSGALVLPASAQNAAYPTKPIVLLVGFAPGGGTDQIARIIAPKASELLKQTIIIENHSGASGMIAATQAARAAPDGYTLLMGHISSNAMVPAIRSKMPYKPAADFTAITILGSVPQVVTVPAAFPAKDIAEFIKLAKTREKHLIYASSGPGTQQHFAAEMFQIQTQTQMVHVPYRGSGAALIDLIAGQVDVSFDTLPSVLPQIKAGRLRALAVTTPQRLPELPNVPTLAESGLPGYDISAWYMLMGPKDMPAPLVTTIANAFIAAVKDPATLEKLNSISTNAVGSTPEQARTHLLSEIDRWSRIAKEKNIHEE